LLELKNPANEHATLKTAWNQVQTYRTDIPAVFTPNALTVSWLRVEWRVRKGRVSLHYAYLNRL